MPLFPFQGERLSFHHVTRLFASDDFGGTYTCIPLAFFAAGLLFLMLALFFEVEFFAKFYACPRSRQSSLVRRHRLGFFFTTRLLAPPYYKVLFVPRSIEPPPHDPYSSSPLRPGHTHCPLFCQSIRAFTTPRKGRRVPPLDGSQRKLASLYGTDSPPLFSPPPPPPPLDWAFPSVVT